MYYKLVLQSLKQWRFIVSLLWKLAVWNQSRATLPLKPAGEFFFASS